MNCKPGDLAIIVSSKAGNEGRIVRCLEFIGEVRGLEGRDRWRIDQAIKSEYTATFTANDSQLRPIRDQPGDDETLSWASKPELATA